MPGVVAAVAVLIALPTEPRWFALVGLLAGVWVLLYEVHWTSRRGQTWGKRLVGISVVRVDNGQPLSWCRAATRWAVLLLPNLIPVVGQMLVFSATSASTWDPRGQGWHDRLARSVVVRTIPSEAAEHPPIEDLSPSAAAEFWRDVGSHPMIQLFGRGIWAMGLVAFLAATVVNRDTFREVLGLALTPLAVIFGVGLREFRRAGRRAIEVWPVGPSPSAVSRLRVSALTHGGSITAILAVLVYLLLLDDVLPDQPPGLLTLARDWNLPYMTAAEFWLGIVVSFIAPTLVAVVVFLVAAPFVLALRHRAIERSGAPGSSPSSEAMQAHWKRRWKARRIDAVIVLGLGAVDILVGHLWFGLEWEEWMRWVHWPAWALIYEYLVALLPGRRGVGKWRAGVRVVDLDGGVPSRSQMATRALLLVGPALLAGIGVGLPWVGSDFARGLVLPVTAIGLYAVAKLHPQGRGLHDMLTRTRVVATAPNPEGTAP